MKTKTIKAILFDFDGTLTVPGLIDFLAVKKAIRCPDNSTILEFIAGLPTEKCRKNAMNVMEKHEDMAARKAGPNQGAEEIIHLLKSKKVKLGILTRNSLKSLKTAMRSFRNMRLRDFDVVITREHDIKLKPHPDGVREACRALKVRPQEMLVVGDYVYDIQAGQGAGAGTVFLESCHTTKWPDPPADFTIRGLEELRGIFETDNVR